MSRHSMVGMTAIFNQEPTEFPSVCSTTPMVWTLPLEIQASHLHSRYYGRRDKEEE